MQVLKSNASMLNVLYRFAARDGKLSSPLYATANIYQASHLYGLVYQHLFFVKEHTQPPDLVSIHISRTNLEDILASNYQLHKISPAQVLQAVLRD